MRSLFVLIGASLMIACGDRQAESPFSSNPLSSSDQGVSAAGKATAAGVLGDVNNDVKVNTEDVNLVLLYLEQGSSFVAPNQGDITLGDVNQDGQIDKVDVFIIMAYIANPLDPSLPREIGLADEQPKVAEDEQPTAEDEEQPTAAEDEQPTAEDEEQPTSVATDRAALIVLYKATGGDYYWTNHVNWLSAAPLSEWYGVTTDDQGRVTRLKLGHNWLVGPIPEELGQLKKLQYLNLAGNELTGEIPEELGQCKKLQYLNLGGNELTGEIPEELGQLKKLQWLFLADNGLTGKIPEILGQLKNLQWLFLADNELTGCIPAALQAIANDFASLGLAFCQ